MAFPSASTCPTSGARLFAALLSLLLVIAPGCGGDSGDRPRAGEEIRLPTTHNPEGTGMDAELRATLAGDPTTQCVWLLVKDPIAESDPEGRVTAVWPAGFTARTDPLRLYDARGRLIASEGELLHLGGGLVSATRFETLGQCRVSQSVWVASAVERIR